MHTHTSCHPAHPSALCWAAQGAEGAEDITGLGLGLGLELELE